LVKKGAISVIVGARRLKVLNPVAQISGLNDKDIRSFQNFSIAPVFSY
jgi:hypothetical protein